MAAYYNEIDDYAAEWLRNLIAAGLIAPGDVDNRSIHEVKPDDLRGYVQCHFFAGIGVWSYALRLAGWPDDRPVWTGSCPCQPFSVAGASGGFDDERHLWPDWHFLIEERRPPVVFGEQVEAAIRHGWLDLVQADMEGIGYAFAAAGIPAAGVGAPHIRQRLWFVADDESQRRGETGATSGRPAQRAADGIAACRMDDDDDARPEGFGGGYQAEGGRVAAARSTAEAGESGGVVDASAGRFGVDGGASRQSGHAAQPDATDRPGPTNGFWRDVDWLGCRDGKWRPVEPGTFPLAHGAASRVGRLRAYGNAINAEAAAEVIRAYMECRP